MYYRLVEIGEIIEHGDEWYSEGEWALSSSVGDLKRIETPMRRKIAETVKPDEPAMPDPGEGYRLIDKAKDVPQKGDEVWNGDDNKQWISRSLFDGKPYDDDCEYRRKVASVLAFGDRVAVKSGTWSGCRGVVTGFRADVSLSGYGKMTARMDSLCCVTLDTVFSGGQKLLVNVADTDLRKLPAAVADPEWRLLAIGEVIWKDDERWFRVDDWSKASGAVGNKITVNHVKLRRRVRIESPGWRYLDAGEVVQAGDEYRRDDGRWYPQQNSTGYKNASRPHEFRRKTTPFAG